MPKLELDIDIACAECKEPLDADVKRGNTGYDVVLIEPCIKCLENEYDKAKDKGYEEGHEEGYDEGFDDGFQQGLEDGMKKESK